jgi:hypothetical protein
LSERDGPLNHTRLKVACNEFENEQKQIDREKRSLVSQLTDFENNKQQWNMRSIERTMFF